MHGGFIHGVDGGTFPVVTETVTGAGMATVTLSPNVGFPGTWQMDRVMYRFSTLPSPWTAVDIGDVGRQGSASFSNGTFTVAGAGADIWDLQDSFLLVSQSVSGDVT